MFDQTSIVLSPAEAFVRQSLFLKEIKAVAAALDSLAEWIFELKQLLDSITPLYIISRSFYTYTAHPPKKSLPGFN